MREKEREKKSKLTTAALSNFFKNAINEKLKIWKK